MTFISLPIVFPAIRECLLEPRHVRVSLNFHHPKVVTARSAFANDTLTNAILPLTDILGELAC